jgi:hypothetical protein
MKHSAVTSTALRQDRQATLRRVVVRTGGTLLLALAAMMTLTSEQARAEEPQQLQRVSESAVNGQLADVGTTGVGLLMGAAEANPLGILTLGMKVAAYNEIKKAPEVEQPRLWGMYGAVGWGAAANNLCIIATLATGGAAAAVCPMIGLAAGMSIYDAGEEERNQATFNAMCKDMRKHNPALECVYTPPAKS